MSPDTSISGTSPSQMCNEHTHSRQSSTSSQDSGVSASSVQHAVRSSSIKQELPTADSTDSLHPRPEAFNSTDPLAREYPKPTEEINVEEALDRKPGKWTLGHYIMETPVQSLQEAPKRDVENATQNMETEKQDLLRAKDELRGLSLTK